MPTGLKRDLGLFSTMAVAIGAMVGSGIFILPGVAYVTVDGPAVVLAFLLAGVLVLPAAISAAEMATAMPEDGGSYVYVERGMGPLLGTIAGVGNWFMLSFKSALALVGGVPYLVYIAPSLAETILFLAVGLAVLFTVINAVSTKSAGGLQFAIVGAMMLVLGWFVFGGVGDITPAQTAGAFDPRSDGLLAATALVFISYAGVIKIAAVAEEVKDPGRTIPRAMIGSLVLTTALYVLVVYVAVGVVDVNAAVAAGELEADGEGPIMALAAERTLGTAGTVAVVLAALLALASTANAGLLSASRFPFAMARDGLAPAAFERVSERFNTPVLAVSVSGAIVVVFIVFLPIDQVAKFGSAFQVIVFILVNVALIGFREGAVDEYEPVFTSPLYPWLQLFGIASGFVVLTQVGAVPFAGAALITLVSVGYYYGYVRRRTDRQGAAGTGIRRDLSTESLNRTAELFADERQYDVLVGVTNRTTPDSRADMLRIALDLSRGREGTVTVGEFRESPHRAFTANGPVVESGETPEWVRSAVDGFQPPGVESNTRGASSFVADDVEFRSVTTEDPGPAIVEFAAFEDQAFVVMERPRHELRDRFRDGVTEHVLRNANCGVLLVEDRGLDDVDEIVVATEHGTYDPVKLLVADAIAEETGASLQLLQTVSPDAPAERTQVIERYHTELLRLLNATADARVIETDDWVAGLARFAGNADLLVTGTETPGIRGDMFGRPVDRLVDAVDCTAVMVQPATEHREGLVKRFLLDRLFR